MCQVLQSIPKQKVNFDAFYKALGIIICFSSHKYFNFMDYLSYNDKLLDAFEERFGDNIQEGVEFVERFCRNNSHI